MSAPALAQHDPSAHRPAGEGWTWTAEGQVFANANLQWRKFTDFHHVESQNWFMTSLARRLGGGDFEVHGMISLEPFTLRREGSSQVFQTGETLDDAPLIDYQHPHDLLMALAARTSVPVAGGWTLELRGGLVDAPALGPTAFMHRPSASIHPTAPLGHHNLDSTHITHGVVTVGLSRPSVTIEGSAFHGGEPDEARIAVELGPLDSYSGRVSWRLGSWSGQVSAARLHQPEAVELTDVTRVTASLGQDTPWREGRVAWLLAWGWNYGTNHDEQAALFEGVWRPSAKSAWYWRGEIVEKNILTAGGLHPPGFEHPHVYSTVGAATIGYERGVWRGRGVSLGLGGDVTVHHTPENLLESYGHPVSAHAFARLGFSSR